MTQPAKVQEPSMEEILASIRRIIADDEAKPAVAEKTPNPPQPAKPAAAAARPAPTKEMPSPKKPAAEAAAAKPAPPPVASNGQDDIDALLAGLDEATPAGDIRASDPDSDVFELTDEMAVPNPSKPAFQRIEPKDDVGFAETKAVSRQVEGSPSAILSQSTATAVESAFNSLARTVLSNNARTLEDLVKEMLRPMLKSWLDDNLPGLVERIVKAEIERVARGR